MNIAETTNDACAVSVLRNSEISRTKNTTTHGITDSAEELDNFLFEVTTFGGQQVRNVLYDEIHRLDPFHDLEVVPEEEVPRVVDAFALSLLGETLTGRAANYRGRPTGIRSEGFFNGKLRDVLHDHLRAGTVLHISIGYELIEFVCEDDVEAGHLEAKG